MRTNECGGTFGDVPTGFEDVPTDLDGGYDGALENGNVGVAKGSVSVIFPFDGNGLTSIRWKRANVPFRANSSSGDSKPLQVLSLAPAG